MCKRQMDKLFPTNIRKNLEDLGLQLDEDSMRKVTTRIIELGDKKELVTQEDRPYIVSDVLKHGVQEDRVKLKSYIVNLAYGLKPMATLKIEINGKEYEESSSGDGQYDDIYQRVYYRFFICL